jgi:Tfp pilus assembly protein PilN
MINLLPPEEKEKLVWEKKKRITAVFWFLVLFSVFCLILLLSLAKIYLQGQLKSAQEILTVSSQGAEYVRIKGIRRRIESAGSDLRKLNSFYADKIYFSDILENVSKILPQEVFLTGLSINSLAGKKEKKKTEISLSGFASTREVLFDFNEELKKDSYFSGVYFSPSNWIKPRDINFFITFKLNDRR